MNLVYKYAIAAPHENVDLIFDQMRAAHRYRNVLVEIEIGRRAAVRAAEVEAGAGGLGILAAAVQTAEDAVMAAVKTIARWRARERKKNGVPQELRATLTTARAAKKVALAAFRDARRTIRTEAVTDEIDLIGERKNELVRSARHYSGLLFGTYQLVEAAASASFGRIPMYDRSGAPSDPRFVRWRGEGSIAVHFQDGGIELGKALNGGSSFLKITQPDPLAWQRELGVRTHRECEQLARQAEVSLRVGGEGRKPAWGTWRLDMHRPLPENAILNWATIHRRHVGPFFKWSLTLTLNVAQEDLHRGRRDEMVSQGSGAVAVDVGWRVIDDELRVAGWQNTVGERSDFRLTARDLELLRAADAIRSARDKRFDAARAALVMWLRAPKSSIEAVVDGTVRWLIQQKLGDQLKLTPAVMLLPDWLIKSTETLHAWRSTARFTALWARWYDARFPGDEVGYAILSNWHAQDHHDWAVESKTREQARLRRREKYRIFAAKLAETYETIVIEDFDKSEVAKLRPVDARDKNDNETSRSNRVLAATSDLIDCLLTAARSRGRNVAAIPCEDTTRTCPVCGLVEIRDAAASIQLECECGATWDQDVDGAPVVLLARWREQPGGAKMLVGARAVEELNEIKEVKETRWLKAARLRKEKEARMAAARKRTGSDGE